MQRIFLGDTIRLNSSGSLKQKEDARRRGQCGFLYYIYELTFISVRIDFCNRILLPD